MTAPRYLSLVSDAADELKSRRDEIDRLNVFPVPDGDTGTNMAFTFKTILEATATSPDQRVDELMDHVAEAALDAVFSGKADPKALIEYHKSKGALAINIIPDRNWNIADPDTKRLKVQKLYEVVEVAQKLDLPLNVGTEMNAFGQKLVDDFAAPELAPVKQAFMDGAYFIYGHTMLQRALGLGYQGATVVVSSRNQQAIDAVAEKISTETGSEALAVASDVTDESSIQSLVDTVVEKYGKIDILVNAMGMNIKREAFDYPLEDWDKLFEVNVKGTMAACKVTTAWKRRRMSSGGSPK